MKKNSVRKSKDFARLKFDFLARKGSGAFSFKYMYRNSMQVHSSTRLRHLLEHTFNYSRALLREE